MPPCCARRRNQAPGGAHPGGATSMRARSRRRESCAKPVLVRFGEANSYLARACLRPVAGGSLRPPPVLDAGGRAPAAPARGSTLARSGYPWQGHRPAPPRSPPQASRTGGGACRQRLSRNAPEAGRGESMPKRGKTGLVSTVSAPFLRPPFRIGKLAPRLGGNRVLDPGRAPPWPTVENPKRHATATLCRIVGLCLSGD